ncbi:hypothetical protein BV898_08929 [Hypsibius exemplaris]|uniref:Uncharacterized protein n=1 Tax=Hypsibius exemplaris TaxID=2072580 RepID=A0A1W0WP50_HYPEX|nr:hypothetical protein BV898_08929 [Hypsibius exemplaris]
MQAGKWLGSNAARSFPIKFSAPQTLGNIAARSWQDVEFREELGRDVPLIVGEGTDGFSLGALDAFSVLLCGGGPDGGAVSVMGTDKGAVEGHALCHREVLFGLFDYGYSSRHLLLHFSNVAGSGEMVVNNNALDDTHDECHAQRVVPFVVVLVRLRGGLDDQRGGLAAEPSTVAAVFLFVMVAAIFVVGRAFVLGNLARSRQSAFQERCLRPGPFRRRTR